MRDWTLAKIVWVTDRGFPSEQNRPIWTALPKWMRLTPAVQIELICAAAGTSCNCVSQ